MPPRYRPNASITGIFSTAAICQGATGNAAGSPRNGTRSTASPGWARSTSSAIMAPSWAARWISSMIAGPGWLASMTVAATSGLIASSTWVTAGLWLRSSTTRIL